MSSAPDDFLDLPPVELPASALASPEAAIAFLVDRLVEQGRVRGEHAAALVRGVLSRERLGSTAVGRGVAVPHAKTDAVDSPVAIIGRSDIGVQWPVLDNRPVQLVCLLLLSDKQPGESLRALEAVSRRLRG
jgi:mannitol/fructose-specific phosphotransferase system IIA component (Ntr-type)